MTDKPTITQADRDAAWFIRPDCFSKEEYANWRLGVYDGSRSIQTLANHRESAVAELQVEVERLRKALEIIANGADISQDDFRKKQGYRHYPTWLSLNELQMGLENIAGTARATLAQKEPVE